MSEGNVRATSGDLGSRRGGLPRPCSLPHRGWGAISLVAVAFFLACSPAFAAETRGHLLRAPLLLPGDARTASVPQSPSSWIVATRPGYGAAVARRFEAVPVDPVLGIYRVRRSRARAFAAALRGRGWLSFAEPDTRVSRRAFPSEPAGPYQPWLSTVVDPRLDPPPVGPSSPLIADVDTQVDLSHPEFNGGNISSDSASPPSDEHGTAVSAVAAAPANGYGIAGVWPGARLRVFVAAGTCSDTVAALYRATTADAAVINMSYGFEADCFAHYVATQQAFGEGRVLVAAGGNEFEVGNAPSRPAVDPHILTVAALNPDLSSASFSNENNAIDLSAPGVDILTAVPPAFDPDGNPDGYARLDGTSFSSPIAAAAAAWISAVRPGLANDQIAGVLRDSARDLGRPGWDSRFGSGVINLGAALQRRAQRHDPGEPNDDVEWVDGRRFRGADAPIFRPGRTHASLSATLDQFEDPADVYRIVLPSRSTLRITSYSRYGDPDLEAYAGYAPTIFGNRGLIARSQRNGRSTDRVYVTNARRHPVTAYVDTYINSVVRTLDAGYRLDILRVRYRR